MNGQEWKEIDRNEQQKLAKIKKKKKQNRNQFRTLQSKQNGMNIF